MPFPVIEPTTLRWRKSRGPLFPQILLNRPTVNSVIDTSGTLFRWLLENILLLSGRALGL